jgi:hypothetical protein
MVGKRAWMVIVVAAAFVTFACDDDDDEVEFESTLVGQNERPNPVTTNATGTARVTDDGGTTMSYLVTVSNIQNVTAAHIHVAPADSAGPIVVDLAPNTTITNGTLASGSFDQSDIRALQQGAQPISMDSLRVLMRRGRTYVNVHTTQNQAGEIRGQLALD